MIISIRSKQLPVIASSPSSPDQNIFDMQHHWGSLFICASLVMLHWIRSDEVLSKLELIKDCVINISQLRVVLIFLLRNLKYFFHGDCEKVRGLNCELLLWISPPASNGIPLLHSRNLQGARIVGAGRREGSLKGALPQFKGRKEVPAGEGGGRFDSTHIMQPAIKLSQSNSVLWDQLSIPFLLPRRVKGVQYVFVILEVMDTCVAWKHLLLKSPPTSCQQVESCKKVCMQ